MADVPWIRGLSPVLVERQRFAFSRWYRASGLWYYHCPGFCAATALSDGAYNQIDPALRRLCRLLHAHGLATTPSCQGHFYTMRYFRDVWRVLRDEAGCIRDQGLLVEDAGSGETFRFADRDYVLPWANGEAFCQAVHRQQQVGYLGVVVPHAMGDWSERLLAMSGFVPRAIQLGNRAVDEERRLIDMYVRANDSQTQRRAWAALTEAVAARLRG